MYSNNILKFTGLSQLLPIWLFFWPNLPLLVMSVSTISISGRQAEILSCQQLKCLMTRRCCSRIYSDRAIDREMYTLSANTSLVSTWIRMAPNGTHLRLYKISLSTFCLTGTNLGLFKISFSIFWLCEPKCTETDLKKSQICNTCIWVNLTQF